MKNPHARGLLLPRMLPLLLGLSMAFLGAVCFTGRPCSTPAASEASAALATARTVDILPAKPGQDIPDQERFSTNVPIADLVGVYRASTGCQLWIDTIGQATGCGYRGWLSVKGHFHLVAEPAATGAPTLVSLADRPPAHWSFNGQVLRIASKMNPDGTVKLTLIQPHDKNLEDEEMNR